MKHSEKSLSPKVSEKKRVDLRAENVELDARIVLAGMKGGMMGIMDFGFQNRSIFPTTEMLTDRCYWLKEQSEEYINKVSKRAAQLEKRK